MSKKRIISLIIIGLLLSGISVFATYLIECSDVRFNNENINDTNSNGTVDVQDAIDYIFNNMSSGEEAEEYTITYNAQNSTSNTTGTSTAGGTYGELPTPTTVPSGKIFAGWYTEEEGGIRITPDTVITGDGTIYAHWADSQFGADTWDTILDYVRNHVENDTVSRYSVGDTKEVDLGTYGVYTVRVANNSNYDCALESKTACGFVVEFAYIITTHNMNSSGTNVGGWEYSEMRSWLNTTLLSAFPEDMQRVMTATKVVSGYESGKSANYITADKLYLLSPHEVWEDVDGDTSIGIDYYDTSYSNTRQLDFYKNKNVTTSRYNNAVKEYEGSIFPWWLRTADPTNSYAFLSVYNNGRWTYYGSWMHQYASGTKGVSPAFRIE